MGIAEKSCVIILIIFLLPRSIHAQVASIGTLAPDFTLIDIDGNSFSLSDYNGKVVILDFFSTTCAPCRSEMKQLKVVQEEFRAEIVIISISINVDYDSDERLKQFREDFNITWILARDTANVRDHYFVPSIPTLCIIDQEGYIRYYDHNWEGAQALIEEISKIMQKVLRNDLNNDGEVDILDISIVAVAFGSRLGDENWNEVADIDGDGSVNILDVGSVARHYGKTS